jgi:hypothetical protein
MNVLLKIQLLKQTWIGCDGHWTVGSIGFSMYKCYVRGWEVPGIDLQGKKGKGKKENPPVAVLILTGSITLSNHF